MNKVRGEITLLLILVEAEEMLAYHEASVSLYKFKYIILAVCFCVCTVMFRS